MDNHDKLATLVRMDDEASASIVVSALIESGVPAMMTGGAVAGFRAEAPGYVNVVISEKDIPAAQKILKSLEFREDIDWSKIDVGHPLD